MAYVGVDETPARAPAYHPSPVGRQRLPAEIVEASSAFDEVLLAAIMRGETSEDTSQGHSLVDAPEVREIQERFVDFAVTYRDELLDVLHNSADSDQRAIAALVAAYMPDKRAVVPHLVHAALDVDSGVRNNATRALMIIAMFANENSSLGIEIAAEQFIDMLGSIRQTDRNKGSALLMYLTESRDPLLMSEIRIRALFALKCATGVGMATRCHRVEYWSARLGFPSKLIRMTPRQSTA